MPDYLYDKLTSEFGKRTIQRIQIPNSIAENLNPNFALRPYQIEAFQRFICYFENEFDFKERPTHLLYNMATGSGKTLIMAGLILYLYEKGYRNFLFFVNSNTIIEKTKDNFLNQNSIKYLFNKNLNINNKRIHINSVVNFEAVNPNEINICFTTIHKLHIDYNNVKENSLTYEDFKKHKIILIGDEAHHINVSTKTGQELFESWENTVEKIFRQNTDNLLLEFTATHDYKTPSMVDKYINKVIFKYDIVEYRKDLFSKDIVIVQSDLVLNERILQALILSEFKKLVAAKNKINLKPVILFKAQRTIQQSVENKENFHKLITNLSEKEITNLRKKSNLNLLKYAFDFFDNEGIDTNQLVERLQYEYQPNFCLSVNNDADRENYQILVNTLEEPTNRIRAIFAVQKLNEGWDVLNLFDIVRCYEARDTGRAKIGSTTLSEAQLIGRGARYFPFITENNNDRFKRKFDEDLSNELRILEELHYHSINNSRYIAEIRQALREQGWMEEQIVRQLELKETFLKTDFYKYGIVWHNNRIPKNNEKINSFSDLGIAKNNIIYNISTGKSGTYAVLAENEQTSVVSSAKNIDIRVSDIEKNIVQTAISRNPFFTFSSIKRFFPNIKSIKDIIASDDYLGGLSITFIGAGSNDDIPVSDKLLAVQSLLNQIEDEIKANIVNYEGTTEFVRKRISEIFTRKDMKFDNNNPMAIEDKDFDEFVKNKDWFAYKTIYGTTEEKNLVFLVDRIINELEEKYDQIYLLRNEKFFSLYDFKKGRTFQPDFVLFLSRNNGNNLTFQLFIEPKGGHIAEGDRWKEDFLKEITDNYSNKKMIFENNSYRLVGVPFYEKENENEVKDFVIDVLK